MEVSDVRRRLRGAVEDARRRAAERRLRVDEASRSYEAFLDQRRRAGVPDHVPGSHRRGLPIQGADARPGRPSRTRPLDQRLHRDRARLRSGTAGRRRPHDSRRGSRTLSTERLVNEHKAIAELTEEDVVTRPARRAPALHRALTSFDRPDRDIRSRRIRAATRDPRLGQAEVVAQDRVGVLAERRRRRAHGARRVRQLDRHAEDAQMRRAVGCSSVAIMSRAASCGSLQHFGEVAHRPARHARGVQRLDPGRGASSCAGGRRVRAQLVVVLDASRIGREALDRRRDPARRATRQKRRH